MMAVHDGVSIHEHLLEIITKQEAVITKQNKMIAELINKNHEQENFIEVLTREI